MTGAATANGHTPTHFDIIIVGSGLSGINAAYRVQELLPDSSFTILESRHELGGTWSQFKYPGVRSDSDLHTLGFQFYPWKASHAIASGDSIMDYLHETADKFGIKKHIRYRHKVLRADWRTGQQRWKVDVLISSDDREVAPRTVTYWTKWLIMGSGYYSYDEPLKALIPGLDNFKGKTVHPQFWPEDLDYKGKKMVIIGSGATTITLLPALVDTGVGSVTQLQRSPSYIMSVPQEDPKWWEKFAPEWFVLRYKRKSSPRDSHSSIGLDFGSSISQNFRLRFHPSSRLSVLLLPGLSRSRCRLSSQRSKTTTACRLSNGSTL